MHSVIDQHHALGRIDDNQRAELQQAVANRFYNEQQYGCSTGAPASPYSPSDPDFQTSTRLSADGEHYEMYNNNDPNTVIDKIKKNP